MKVSISIDKKILDNVKKFCKLNNKNYLEYITDAIEEKLSIDMYGDLNEKLKKKDQPKMQKAEDYIQEKLEKKSEKTEVPIIKAAIEPLNTGNISDDIVVENKTKTRRRILNSK